MTPQALLKLGDIDAAIWATSRGEAAPLVRDALATGVITFEALRPHLLMLWQSTDYPCRRLPRATWLAWFQRAAMRMPELPRSAIRAWRAQVGDELGLSWTYDLSVAQRFHSMNARHPDGRILAAIIPAHAIGWCCRQYAS